jgi:hypothetical protein
VGCFGHSFLGFGVLFPFSISCCGLAFGVSCVYFLCTKGRLYAFLINLFLSIKKKNFQPIRASLFSWKSVWKVRLHLVKRLEGEASISYAFFTWMTALDKILMIDNLRRQGLTLVNWCCLCKKSEETVNHLLIHCEFTSELWHLVLGLFGFSWVMPGNILEL